MGNSKEEVILTVEEYRELKRDWKAAVASRDKLQARLTAIGKGIQSANEARLEFLRRGVECIALNDSNGDDDALDVDAVAGLVDGSPCRRVRSGAEEDRPHDRKVPEGESVKRSKKIPLPCPFCGQAYEGIVPPKDGSRMECPFCGAMGPFPTGGKRGETPVEAWNLRVKHVLAPRKPRTKKKGDGDGEA